MFTELETLLFILVGLLMWRLRGESKNVTVLRRVVTRVADGVWRLRVEDNRIRIDEVRKP